MNKNLYFTIRFNQIISSNISTMRKLPLFITENNLSVIKGLTRKFHTIRFESISIKSGALATLLKQRLIGSVKVIEIINVNISPPELQRVLKKFGSQLEKLLIVDSKVLLFKRHHLIDFPHLRTIVFMQSDLEFFEFIGKTALQTLKIHHNSFGINDEEIMEEFLMRCGSLQNLAVRVHPGKIFFALTNDDEKDYKFKLKRLSVTYNSFGSRDVSDDKFMEFLKQHEDTLEYLEIDCKLTDEAYEYVFKKLKLKSLRIDGSKLPARPLFYTCLTPNNHLKKLFITKELKEQGTAQLFGIYKSINNLAITQWTQETSSEILISIANNLNQLKKLNIPDIPENPTEIPIPSLQSLRIECIQNVQNFRVYVTHHVNVKDLSVKWILQELTHDTMSAISSQLQNLEVLSFGPTFKPTRRLYTTMKQNAPNLSLINIFRFRDENVEKVLEKFAGINTHYFTNESSPLIFETEFGMWDEEDMIFPFSSNDLVDNVAQGFIFLDDDDNDDDTDDSDMNFNDDFELDDWENAAEMMMFGGVLQMMGFH